jgi:hypothetical protein
VESSNLSGQNLLNLLGAQRAQTQEFTQENTGEVRRLLSLKEHCSFTLDNSFAVILVFLVFVLRMLNHNVKSSYDFYSQFKILMVKKNLN